MAMVSSMQAMANGACGPAMRRASEAICPILEGLRIALDCQIRSPRRSRAPWSMAEKWAWASWACFSWTGSMIFPSARRKKYPMEREQKEARLAKPPRLCSKTISVSGSPYWRSICDRLSCGAMGVSGRGGRGAML